MKIIVHLVVVCLAIFVLTLNCWSQAEVPPIVLPDLPQFYFDALSYMSDQEGVSRLDLYVEVPFEGLRFIKQGNMFLASYEIMVSIHDTTDKLVEEKTWDEHIETQDYDVSVSPRAGNLSHQSFLITPGRYVVTVQVRDNETKKTSRNKGKVTVQNFSKLPFSISDLMLVRRIEIEDEKKVISPNISATIGDISEGFNLFFEIYNSISADSTQILVNIRNVKGDIVQRDTFMQQLDTLKKSSFPRVNSSQLIAGNYVLEVEAIPLGAHVEKPEESKQVGTAFSSRTFVVRWQSVPLSIVDLDLAIDQMQYIMEKETIDEMKKVHPDRKREMWREFWKKRDPTQNTDRNELMEEYYARVAYANKHFGHYIDGWKTDMGMVYIIFGAPSSIERHPFDIDSKPYEIWTYYELNREFIFVDATGFGDYRLQSPIWDRWRTRPR
ncbi:MAG: GWxTD domain-containing protein [Ignavibacteriae bacterium]|nr:GWxTD domain-containing protein [Ignavibacteriota bacterium]